MKPLIIDADSHILEPMDLWQNYLEPRYRDQALHIETDDKGFQHWVINGKVCEYRYGVFGDMGAIGQKLEPYFTPGAVTYEEGCRLSPGGVDPHERVKVLDAEGIDKVLLYPSLGITWEQGCDSPQMSTAYCRAYNNWLIDFCSAYPDRLIPIAHVSMQDASLAAEELARAVKAGAKGAMLRAYPSGDRPYGRPENDVFWATAQDLDVPVALHIGANNRLTGHDLFDIKFGPGTWVVGLRHVCRRCADWSYQHDAWRGVRAFPQTQNRAAGIRLWLDRVLAGPDGRDLREPGVFGAINPHPL